MAGVSTQLNAYREDGFAVLRAVFGPADVAELSQAFDEMKAVGSRHPASFRHGNVLYVVGSDPVLGPVLRLMQWASYIHPVLARYRNHPYLLSFLEPLIGRDLKQFTNSLIWKQPGAVAGGFAYHQDCRFRRPADAFRNLETSIVQSAIALDPHRVDNGCMRMLRGSHRRGDLRVSVTASVYDAPCDEVELERVGLDPTDLVDVILDPGDVVVWHPCTVHGSHPNQSPVDRRSYINGYAVARDCDRGEWAFRDGQPCPLGNPVLIQYEDLFVRPEPHYLDGPPHPFEPD